MKKVLHYVIAAAALAGVAWFGYHWQQGSDPLAGLTGRGTGDTRPSSGEIRRGSAPTLADKQTAGRDGLNKAGGPRKAGGAGMQGGDAKSGKSARPVGGQRGKVVVEVATVQAGIVEERVSAVGSLLAAQSVLIKPEIDGRIAKLHINDGSAVASGVPLFKIDSAVVDAEVAQAQAELTLALNNLRRTRNLAKQNFVSRRSREEAQSNVTVLRARLQVVKARQSRTEIVAPFAGTVGLLPISIGEYVEAGTELVRLDDLSSLKLDLRVPERLLPLIKSGQAIRVTFDAYPKQVFTARVQTIDSQIDKSGRSIVVRGRLDNSAGLLRPGMFARAALVLASRDDALLVPETCLVPGADSKYVYRIADGNAIQVPVTTGVRQDGKVEVLSGLKVGDRIVSSGQIKLRGPKVAVKIIESGSVDQRTKKSASQPDKSRRRAPEKASLNGNPMPENAAARS